MIISFEDSKKGADQIFWEQQRAKKDFMLQLVKKRQERLHSAIEATQLLMERAQRAGQSTRYMDYLQEIYDISFLNLQDLQSSEYLVFFQANLE